MAKGDEQKQMGIIIRSLEEVEKFTSLEDYILGTFYGRDLTETEENTALAYFLDYDLADGIFKMFGEEICQRVDYNETFLRIKEKIERGQISEADCTYEMNKQMTIDAISEICAEIYGSNEKVDANPDKLLVDIFNEKEEINDRDGR